MANDKKFIVKNGLQTLGDVLIGTSTDDGVSKLQVDGPTHIEATLPSYPTLKVTNDSGSAGAPIIQFVGPSGALNVENLGTLNDYGIFNSTNGIEFHNGNDGLVFKQNGVARLSIENGNTTFTGLSTTNIEGRRIITTDDEARNGGSFDAATLDGLDSIQFVRSDEDDTMDGSYIITGNLTVFGTTTTISSETVTIADNILLLNSNVTGTPSENAGIEIERGTSTNVSFIWNEAADWWTIGDYALETIEIRSVADNDLLLRAASSGSANVNITGGYGTSYQGLRSAKVGVEGWGEILYNSATKLKGISDGIEATENLDVKGDITIGDNNGAAQIFFDGSGLNNTLYSNNGEIGFLKQNFNYGAYLNSDEDWIVSGNNVAQGNIISEGDITAYDDIVANNNINATNGNITADAGNIAATTGNVTAGNSITAQNNITATTGNIDATAGNVTAGNDVSAGNDVTAANDVTATAGDVTAGQDVIATRDISAGRDANITEDLTANNAYITNDLTADDIISQTINANSAIIGDITANNIVADQDIRSGRFVDNDDDTYFFDGDKASVANTIGIDTYIFHNGDTDTRMGFDGADQISFQTGGTERLNIDNNSADFTVGVYAPTFYDSDDSNYFVNPASASIMSSIYIDDFIYHAQSINDYMGFAAANDWRVTIGSTLKLNVTDAITQSFNNVRAPRYLGASGTTYYLDLDNTGNNTSLAVDGRVQIGNVTDVDRWNDNTGTGGISLASYNGFGGNNNPSIAISGANGAYALMYMNRIDMGNNPFDNSNRYIHFYKDGSPVQKIAGDTTGNLNFVPDSDATAVKFWNASADNLFTINGGGAVVVGGESATYGSSDATPVLGSITNNRLHVNGSIQLNGNNDAIVFGRGTSSFLKDEELGFGWGSGWYQTDATYLRVRNNATIYSTGDIQAGNFVSSANTTYFVDPDGTSVLSTIDIDDYIRHRGDVNTYFGFEANDTIRFWTNGTQRLNIDNNSADFSINVYAPRYYDSNDNNYYGDFASTSNMSRIDIDDFIRHRGDTTTYFGFTANDQIRFFTNNAQRVNIDNDSVDFLVADYGTLAYRNVFYDRNDTSFYIDGNSESRLNTLRLRKTGDPSDDFNALWIDNGTGTGDIDTPESWINFQFQDSNANFTPQVRIGATTGYNDGSSSDNLDKEGSGNFIVQTAEGTGGAGAGALATTFYVNYRGDAYASRSMRSPIFYDHNNDAFFGNFAGQSRMSTIQLDDGVVLRSPNGDYGSFAITGQARGGYEGFSINDRMVFMHDNNNRVGVYNDVDNEWIWYADRNAAMRLMYNGGEQFRTENGYAFAPNQMRSPIFYDSNNTSYYADPASTSIFNIMRANRYQVDGSTYYIDTASGDYGSIRVEGAKNGWAGYAIRDDYVFMSNGANEVGIYNDTDNEWILKGFRNARLELMYNGGVQAQTQNGYFDMPNQARSPIYYDRNNTGYYGDFASHSRMSSISVGNQGAIANNTYAMSLYHNNRYMLAIRSSLAGSQYPWLVNENWNGYDGTARESLIFHFNAVGDRFWFDKAGNFKASKSITAPEINLNGGNGNLNLSPAYGSGHADQVLFDGTEYFDKRVTQALAPNENSLTTSTSEFVRATTGPFAGSYVLQTSGYRDFYSAYIPVEPGEELYGEISVRRISGSGGVLYYGIERYDQNISPIAGNSGTTYFVASNVNYTSTNWSTYRGYTTIPSNCYYVRIRILMNYSGGGALRQYAGIMLKRSNYHGRLRGDDIVVTGDVTADRYYDRNDTNYYLDPASTSYVNDIRFNIGYDRNNTNYYINPASTSRLANIDIAPTLSNGYARIRSIMTSGYPALEYSDSAPGNSSGDQHFVWGANDTGAGRMQLRWRGGTAFGSAWYSEGTLLAEFIGDNSAVNFPQSAGVRSPIFYDYNNTGYYVNPASTSRMVHLRLSSGDSYLKVGSNAATQTTRDGNRPQIEIGANHAYPHFTLSSWGTNTNHGGVISFRSRRDSSNNVRRWNIGTANYQANSLDFGYYDNQENPHYGVGTSWSQDAYTRFIIRTGYTEAKGSMRSPIFYDVNDTNYYGDFASTSRLNDSWHNQLRMRNGGQMLFYTNEGNGEQTIRGYIRATSSNDAHFQFATSGGEDIRFMDGGLSGTWNMIIRGDGDTLINRNIYAQVFYDRNNSGYYTNPASTSRMNVVTADQFNMADRGDWITFYGDDSTYHGIASRDSGGSTSDDIRINTYGSLFINLDSNNNNSSGADFRIGRHGAATGTISNFGLFDVYGDALYVYTGYSFRAPIFYDSNNTAYYVDPAGTSRLANITANFLQFDNGFDIYDDDADTLSIRSNNSDHGEIIFRDSNSTACGRIYWDDDGQHFGLKHANDEWGIYLYENAHTYIYYNGRWEARADSGYWRSERSSRAPIFYDLNNTFYYTNPASTSRLNAAEFYGKAYFYARQNDSAGSHSSYDVTGTDYLNNVAAEFWSGNDAPVTIYFRSGVNAPSDHAYITFDPDFNNTGENAALVLGVDNDGTGSSDYIRLQGRVELHSNLSSSDNSEMQGWWYQTTKYARLNTDYFDHISDIRSPIFYDRNNTGYYVNPASTSNLNTVLINRLRLDDGGSSGHLYTDDTYLDLRYGATGGGGVRLYDSQGQLQGYWYGSGGGEHGLLDNDGAWAVRVRTSTNPLELRCNNNTEFYVYTSYTYSPGSSRAPIFYDANNTGYYFDGASTSRSNYHRINNLYDSQERRYTSPNGGTYTTTSSSVTGAIRIGLPRSRYRSATMMKFKVTVYEYSTGRMHEFIIGGYNYSGDNNWYNESATQLTDDNRGAYTVRWGRENFSGGNRDVVWIGESNSSWSYPQVHVQWIDVGYSGYSTAWGQDWVIGFDSNGFSNVSRTRTASLVYTLNNRDNWAYDMRARIFYDNNNTSYYVDPNGTSRLANVTMNFLQFDNGFDIYDDDSDTMSIRSNNSDHGEIIFRDSNSTACGRIYWDDDGQHFGLQHANGEWAVYMYENSHTYIYYNGRWEARADSGYWRSERSSRAPIFYDLNNTGYYFNGASDTSAVVNGGIKWGATNAESRGGFIGRHGSNSGGLNTDAYPSPGYSIGYSYRPSGTGLSNHYGYGYAHTNASFFSLSGQSGWGFYVSADGDARVQLSGSNGTVSCTGNVVAYASDGRLKENVTPITEALDKLHKIRGVEYDWVENIESEYDFHPTKMHEVGVIAQEVEAVLPEVVVEAPFNANYTMQLGRKAYKKYLEERDGEEWDTLKAKEEFEKLTKDEMLEWGTDHKYLTVNYERITALLIEAVKDVDNKYKEEVSSLREEIAELKKMILNK